MPLPSPPIHSAITPSTQTGVTLVMAAFAIGAFVYALYHWRSSGTPVFLMMFIAGGAMMALEAFVDTVGGCWFPRIHSWVVFTAYGRPIPLWLCLAYFFYFGILGGTFWTRMRGGISARGVWWLFLIGIVGDAIFEITLLRFHTYIYYGGQPLRILRFPFWWAPVNALIVIVAAGAVARFEKHLAGWRALQIIPIAMSASAAVNAICGWPSWLVIDSKMPWLPRQAGGILTFVLAAWIVALMVRVLAPPQAGEAPPSPALSATPTPTPTPAPTPAPAPAGVAPLTKV